jgi:hypothetical protein
MSARMICWLVISFPFVRWGNIAFAHIECQCAFA